MSSHHVVREKQEPALLVLSLQNFSHEYLGQLLEWSPTVIATPDSFDAIDSEGIKVDWLVGNIDIEDLQNDVKMISSTSASYLTSALEHLVDKGYSAVNIITNKLQPEVFDNYADNITIAMFCGNEKLFAVKSGYEKWMPAGDIIRVNNLPPGFRASGLNKLSDSEYQTVVDGIIRLEFDAPRLLISELL